MKTQSFVLPITALLLIAAASASPADGDDKGKYEVKIEQVKPQPAMTIRFRAAPEKLAEKYGEAFGAVFGYVMSNGGQLAGPPFGRYHSMSDGKFDIEAGLPVAKALAEKGGIKASSLPGGTVATTLHVGPYEKLGEAHEALQSWARTNGKKVTGGVWEYYLTDPGQEPDPNKYQTKLFLPIDADRAFEIELIGPNRSLQILYEPVVSPFVYLADDGRWCCGTFFSTATTKECPPSRYLEVRTKPFA